MPTFRLLAGDVSEILPTLEAESFDAVLCDPPYGLKFMGKAWDHGVPGEPVWREVLRVVKPGAHLIAFGGTRTFHRLAVGIEDAGFEIRDSPAVALRVRGSRSRIDISKALDKAAGAERRCSSRALANGNVGDPSARTTCATEPRRLPTTTTRRIVARLRHRPQTRVGARHPRHEANRRDVC